MSDAMRAPFELSAKGLRKSFNRVEVLHGVDLGVRGGRTLALLGENGAGKSTTVRILAGDYKAQDGTVSINGREADIENPSDAEQLGIRVIYQEFLDAPDLTVAENILMGQLPSRGGFVKWREVRASAARVLESLGVSIPLDVQVGDLGVAERQLIEIARALIANARLLILDEPTSSLGPEEVDRLFQLIDRLRSEGVAIIYITHRLDELQRIADDVLVFRDGNVVLSGEFSEYSAEDLVTAMVGRNLDRYKAPRVIPEAAEPVLEVQSLTVEGEVTDISLDVGAGEIVSVFGRLGCGSSTLAETLFGIRTADEGNVTILGEDGIPQTPREAIARGLGYVSPDRKGTGIFQGLNLGDNVSVARWSSRPWSTVNGRQATSTYTRWKERLGIAAHGGAGQLIETLSGGNQQKVVLARWLEAGVKVMILCEPTRGVDVGAREDIYRVLRDLAEDGMGILVVSSDLEEVENISSRVVVMRGGRKTAELVGDEIEASAIALAAT